jgi:hypothetical protein
MQWFGKAYGAAYESDTEHVETPVGRECSWCGEDIAAGDDGMTMPQFGGGDGVAFHYACHLRGIVGGVNHQQGRCTCCGGDLPPDPPELTRRQAAEAAVRLHYGRGTP